MRTAVDTNVLLDVFSNSPQYSRDSLAALRLANSEGPLIACDVVWAEVRAHFPLREVFEGAMETVEVEFDPCDAACSAVAGEAWKSYREKGGSRTRLIADFLVAAHAAVRADRLLTRDRGFDRRHLPRLEILEP